VCARVHTRVRKCACERVEHARRHSTRSHAHALVVTPLRTPMHAHASIGEQSRRGPLLRMHMGYMHARAFPMHAAAACTHAHARSLAHAQMCTHACTHAGLLLTHPCTRALTRALWAHAGLASCLGGRTTYSRRCAPRCRRSPSCIRSAACLRHLLVRVPVITSITDMMLVRRMIMLVWGTNNAGKGTDNAGMGY
jgi:hypothetical protein